MSFHTAALRMVLGPLADERTRRALGWIVTAILAPVILIAALVICGVGFGAFQVISAFAPAAGLNISGADNYSGDDDFSVNVDPPSSQEDDGSSGDSADDEETGPSDIQRYQGDAPFALELRSSQGLEPLSYQEIYATVAPSVVTITVYHGLSISSRKRGRTLLSRSLFRRAVPTKPKSNFWNRNGICHHLPKIF